MHIINRNRKKEKPSMRVCDLREKEVVNTNNGQILGNVLDVDFDEKCGKICALIVPGPGKCFGLFGYEYEYVIPWCRVLKIGPDIVLVDVCEKEVKKKC